MYDDEQAKVSCQPPAFYSEPDWQGLKTTYEKMVHPENLLMNCLRKIWEVHSRLMQTTMPKAKSEQT